MLFRSSHFICPGQGRYFGDRGSFVGLVSPLDCGAEELTNIRALLFGCTIVWRLSSSYQCVMKCDRRDRLLPVGVTSHVVTFVYDELQTVDYITPARGRWSNRNGDSRNQAVCRSCSLPP